MKIKYHTIFLLLYSAFLCHSQSPQLHQGEYFILNNTISGCHIYEARDYIDLLPNFSYVPLSPDFFSGIINPNLIPEVNYLREPISEERELNKNLVVGSINGNLDISNIGSAIYNIPVVIPPGTNGLVPSISLEYNSAIESMYGDLGTGWRLNGLSAITRTHKTIVHDGVVEGIKMDSDDSFLLDDSRLILTSGTYGSHGSIYHTEMETFSQVTSYGNNQGPEWFLVETKDGKKCYYGDSQDSKVFLPGYSGVYQWLISKIEDNQGNYIEYKYKSNFNDVYIDEIKYTGNNKTNLIPYNLIKFYYGRRSDDNTLFILGKEVKKELLLTEIRVKSEGKMTHKYKLDYIENNEQFNIRSCLNQVNEYGSDGKCMNSTIFTYGDIYTPFSIQQLQSGPTGEYDQLPPTKTPCGGETQVFIGDFNGDMWDDYLTLNNRCGYYPEEDRNLVPGIAIITVDLSTPGSDNPHRVFEHSFEHNGVGFPILDMKIDDINGDGMSDVVIIWDSDDPKLYLLLSTGDVSGNNIFSLIDLSETSGLGIILQSSKIETGDCDGDNRNEIIVCEELYSNTADFKIIQHPNTLSHLYVYNLQGWFSELKYYTSDFNGDKKEEILILDKNGCGIYEPFAINASQPICQSSTITCSSYIAIGDFNGYSREDILTSTSSEKRIHYLTGNILTSYEVFFNSAGPPPANWHEDDTFVSDFNGDGKCDIIQISSSNGIVNLNFIQSTKFNEFSTITKILSTEPEAYKDDPSFYHPGDFNGDGTYEVSYNRFDHIVWSPIPWTPPFNAYEVVYPTQLMPLPYSQKKCVIKSILDGYNKKVILDYKPLSYKYISGQDEFRLLTNHNTASGYPISNFNSTSYFLESIKYPTTNSDFITCSFLYEDALTHKAGRNFIGFGKIITSVSTGERIVKENELIEEIPLFCNKSTSIEKPMGNTLSYSQNTYQLFNTFQKVYFIYVSNIYSNDYITNNEYNTTFYYAPVSDLQYGNLTNKTISVNNGTTGTETSIYEYVNAGSWCPSKINKIQVINERDGEGPLTRKVSLDYYTSGPNLGLLKTFIRNPDLPNNLISEISLYDEFGNIKMVNVTAADIEERSELYEYDYKGRYMTKYINSLNQVIENKYDNKYGNIIQTSDINQLITKFEYDGFGRNMKIIFPDGNTSIIAIGWNDNGTHNNALYYTNSVTSGYSPVKEYFDFLGRKVQRIDKGFEEDDIVEDYVYNAIGLLEKQSEPHFTTGSQINWIQYKYEDPFYRCTEIQSPANNLSYCYNNNSVILKNNLTQEEVRKSYNPYGELIEVNEQNESNLINYLYNSMGQLREINVSGSVTTIEFDPDYGFQTGLIDPDAGIYAFAYNSLGELTFQTDPNGITNHMIYDKIGRLINISNEVDGIISYIYDTEVNGKGKLAKIIGYNGIEKSFKYDSYSRPWRQAELIDGNIYNTDYQYNEYGLIAAIKYPSGFALHQAYNNGYLLSITRLDNNELIYLNEKINALNQVEQYKYGNNIRTIKSFNSTDHVIEDIEAKHVGENVPVLHYGYDHYQDSKFISMRKDFVKNLYETFEYDPVYFRLQTITGFNGAPSSVVTYESNNNGNIERINEMVYSYGNGGGSPHAVSSITNFSAQQQNISYTTFNKVSLIKKDNEEILIKYGPEYSRKKSVFKENNEIIRIKYHLDNYEKILENSINKELHYINGSDGLALVYVKQSDNSEKWYYIHKDHLGSIIEITDENGEKVSNGSASYDAWGNRRDPISWQPYASYPSNLLIDRGFTSHEHYDRFGIINMNGRCYDPRIARFLSPDIVIQNLENSQNYNRYSYCLNNPINFIDPFGFQYEYEYDYDNYEWFPPSDLIMNQHELGIITLDPPLGPLEQFFEREIFIIDEISPFVYEAFDIACFDKINENCPNFSYNSENNEYSYINEEQDFDFNSNEDRDPGFENDVSDFYDDALQFIDRAQYSMPVWGACKSFGDCMDNGDYIGASAHFIRAWAEAFMLKSLPTWNIGVIGNNAAKTGTNLVYQGVDKAGVVRYVGITEREAAVRFTEHLNSGTAKSLLQYRVVDGATGLTK